MPEAGWYQDPHNPEQQRYWDGSTWTEHTHDAPFHMSQAPTQAQGSGAQGYGAPGQAPGYINEIGEWLSRSFRVLFANAMPVFILLVLSLIPAVLIFLAIGGAVNDVVVRFDGFDAEEGFTNLDIDGLSGGAFGLAALMLILGPIIAAIFSLAQSFVLHRGHLGQSASLGSALSAGLKGLPRYIGWTLAIMLAIFGTFILIGFVLAVLAAVSDALVALLMFVLVIAAIPVVIWYLTKTAFLNVACAVAPTGQSALRASTERSKGRFWGVFGRILLLFIIGFFVSLIVNGITGSSYTSALGVGAGGDLTINGVALSDLNEVRLGDVLPFGSEHLIATIIGGLLSGAVSLYNRSGVAGLYADTAGPTDEVPASEGPIH